MSFVGNAKAVKLLNKAIENGKVSQAYIFSGPESVGKFTLAKLFAKSLIENAPLDINREFKNIPDLIILEPEIEEKRGVIKEKEIKVERIRKVQKDLSLFPYNGKYKILIINNAHKMGLTSQNSLLKILEEPNKTSIVILVTHSISEIIPTIRSRCQILNFSLLADSEIRKIIGGNKKIDDISIFSMGRSGLALKMIEHPEELETRKKDAGELKNFPELGTNERLKLAEKMALNSTKAVEKLEFWIWLIRAAVFKKGKNSGFFSFKTIAKIEEALKNIKNTNANVRLVIENLFLEI